jgi:hypothetical protein
MTMLPRVAARVVEGAPRGARGATKAQAPGRARRAANETFILLYEGEKRLKGVREDRRRCDLPPHTHSHERLELSHLSTLCCSST